MTSVPGILRVPIAQPTAAPASAAGAGARNRSQIAPDFGGDFGGSSYAIPEPIAPRRRAVKPVPEPVSTPAPAPVVAGRAIDYGDIVGLFSKETGVVRTGRLLNYTGSRPLGARGIELHGLGSQESVKTALKFDTVEDARAGVDALAVGPRQSDSVWAILKAPTQGVIAARLLQSSVYGYPAMDKGDDTAIIVSGPDDWDGPSSPGSFDLTDGSLRIKSVRPDLLEVLTPYFTLKPDENGILKPA